MSSSTTWDRYTEWLCDIPGTGLTLDVSRVSFDADRLAALEPAFRRAFDEMSKLEAGAIANPDEERMVGHYWLRDSARAPNDELRKAIDFTVDRVQAFARDVHSGAIPPERRDRFEHVLLIGIGGSALGPQLASDALGGIDDRMTLHYFDNTDPDGMSRTIRTLGTSLDLTLAVVISKSGGTPETRNGAVVAARAFEGLGLSFPRHAVAVTSEGSKLDKQATSEGWLARFPMWDWVGGRTSLFSAVGLLPAALQGIDIRALLDGARAMDEATRPADIRRNPAALLAAMWHIIGDGRGTKDMVILPYKDRLMLMSKYLQQLVMESLGKEKSRQGDVVNQGIAVYGNKGSTDQHAYIQQLRDGLPNFFATFIQVLADANARSGPSQDAEVDEEVTCGDYLLGFLLGTRAALKENGRDSIGITLDELTPKTFAALIALYERAVGLYASLVDINAYHQPGVEAGKKAAARVIDLQRAVIAAVRKSGRDERTVEQIAEAAGSRDEAETVYKILQHLAANGRFVAVTSGEGPGSARFRAAS